MQPTEALREQLRGLLDEQIPEGGSDADTLFTDAEIDALLRAYQDLNLAAAQGWSQKAGRVMRDDLQEIAVGAERYKAISPVDKATHARQMAEMYAQQAPRGGSTIVSIDPPNVLGIEDPLACADVSRLYGWTCAGRGVRLA